LPRRVLGRQRKDRRAWGCRRSCHERWRRSYAGVV